MFVIFERRAAVTTRLNTLAGPRGTEVLNQASAHGSFVSAATFMDVVDTLAWLAGRSAWNFLAIWGIRKGCARRASPHAVRRRKTSRELSELWHVHRDYKSCPQRS